MRSALFVAAVVSFAASVQARAADTVVSFSYDSLLGTYDAQGPNQGAFTARAVDQPLLRTVGDFNRTIDPPGNADFPAGFVSDTNQADIFLQMTTTRTGASTFHAVGSLTITDLDGDRFLTDITGAFLEIAPGFNFFLPEPFINPRFESDDGFFNGYNGSWSLEGLTNLALGEQSSLLFVLPSFNASFNDWPTGVFAQLIPTPPAAALLLAGLVPFTSRRRAARA